MFVKNLMVSKKELVTVSKNDSVQKALNVMDESGYQAVPVVEEGKFFGAISKEAIFAYYFEKDMDKEEFKDNFKVKDIMESNIPTIMAVEQIEEAAYLLEKKDVPFIAVSDDENEFIGIITHNKLFHVFKELFGFNKGERLSVLAYDIPGQLSKLSKIIYENGGDIISFVTIDTESVTDLSEIVIRLKNNKLNKIKEKIKEAGFKIL